MKWQYVLDNISRQGGSDRDITVYRLIKKQDRRHRPHMHVQWPELSKLRGEDWPALQRRLDSSEAVGLWGELSGHAGWRRYCAA